MTNIHHNIRIMNCHRPLQNLLSSVYFCHRYNEELKTHKMSKKNRKKSNLLKTLMFSGSTEFRVSDTIQCLPANKTGYCTWSRC
jgi:hypothetical protein